MTQSACQYGVGGRSLRGCSGIAALLLVIASTAGCTSTGLVEVETSFPAPLVESLPLRAGVFFPEELRGFTHSETIPQHSQWHFELGGASIELFNPVFSALFDQVTLLEQLPAGEQAAYLDLIVAPQLERFEFDIPRNRDVKFVEVWMQYRLYVYTPDGTPIAEWPVTGYGKSPASGSMPRNSLHDATVRAMREAGATISIRFASQPDVRDWLQEKSNAKTIVNAGG
ncbi:MAG: hypothetical protein JJU27_15685 [Gammaproteobacteria bacterium]|nr:hypothetical protein [Gammaproteobacteria bacterium]